MQLSAGPIQLQYENGFLRTLTVQGEEVLRMIYFALRDRYWNTARLRMLNETIQTNADSFAISYDWQVDDLAIQMAGTVQISGQPDSTISFAFYGKALNTFLRNRVGCCVLHPIEGVAGQPCQVDHMNGQTTDTVFPDLIYPHQPFFDVSALRWQMSSGRQFLVRFTGDVFETEDQRNWTDASFKTYCTPLERPFPAEVPAGTEIRQQITFVPVLLQPSAGQSPQTNIQTNIGNQRPRIGLGFRADGPPLTDAEANLLKTLGLSHLRADVWLSRSNWPEQLMAAWHDAQQLNVPLELTLLFGTDWVTESQEFIDFARTNNLALYTLSLFEADSLLSSDPLLVQVVPLFRKLLPAVKLGGGTDTDFVDLNRQRFNVDLIDFVTYAVNPQVHAFDDQTILENVAAQADTIRSAQALSGGKPVHISPITLLPRFNPAAGPRAVDHVAPADPRQRTTFGAEWTHRSLQTVARAGADSVTYFETHGPRGLLDGGEVYPLFAAIAQFQKTEPPLSPD